MVRLYRTNQWPFAVHRQCSLSRGLLWFERLFPFESSHRVDRGFVSVPSKPCGVPSAQTTTRYDDDDVNDNEYVKLQTETRALVQRGSLKIRGSVQHDKLRRRHATVFCRAVREGLRSGNHNNHHNNSNNGTVPYGTNVNVNLHATDCEATKRLVQDLGTGADRGIMPDFSNPDALRGYTLGHFGRALILSELITHPQTPNLISSETGQQRERERKSGSPNDISLASLGGGCGYDFVALAALSDYLNGPRISATVYDYEPAWKDIVADVEAVVQDMDVCRDPSYPQRRPHKHTCGFDSCDITSPLTSSGNVTLATAIKSTNVFACSYVVAENAVRLQQTRFRFFRELFHEASPGSLFLFTDTTHRLWPALIDLARELNDDGHHTDGEPHTLRIAIPHIRCGKNGWQLSLFKDSASRSSVEQFSCDTDKLYDRFTNDNLAHLSRLDRGWKRDERKVRGSK